MEMIPSGNAPTVGDDTVSLTCESCLLLWNEGHVLCRKTGPEKLSLISQNSALSFLISHILDGSY